MRPVLIPVLGLAVLAAPALARPGGAWGGPGWGPSGGIGARSVLDRPSSADREGKVEVARFIADDAAAAALGKGTITVTRSAADDGAADARQAATFEAAVLDALVHAGYQTATASGAQVSEVRVTRSVAVPEAAPHKPVSGEATVGVSNRGSMMGLGINIDLSKPKKALVATRLEARIRDQASGAVLWEGRAEILTREGDSRWTDGKIADRLASALFDRFPDAPAERVALR